MMVVVCATFSFVPEKAMAAEGIDGDIKWRIEGTTLIISPVNGRGAIPDYYDYNYAPWYCVDGKYSYDTITDLVIEQGITEIGNYSFCYFNKITRLDLPYSCVRVGYEAFYNCEKLESVGLYASDIEKNAFVYCYGLKNLYLKPGVTHLYNQAFAECTALRFVELPTSIEQIDDEVFEYDKNLNSVLYWYEDSPSEIFDITIGEENEPLVNAINNGKVEYRHDPIYATGTYNYYDCENYQGDPVLKSVSIGEEFCYKLTEEDTILGDGWWIVDSQLDFGDKRILINGDTKIILLDGCGITTSGGIGIGSLKSLKIYSESLDEDKMGYINITGAPDDLPGLGMNNDPGYVWAFLYIHGGRITAQGGVRGAGIGSGGKNSNGYFYIYNGIITATGGYHGAGMGTGEESIVYGMIYRAKITAKGGEGAEDMGLGYNGNDVSYIGDYRAQKEKAGFTLSNGNVWIIAFGTVLIVGGVVAIVLFNKKKKKTA